MALDNARVMLEQARERAAQAGLDNIDFICGDTGAAELAGLQADCVVINMVLHHTPSPVRHPAGRRRPARPRWRGAGHRPVPPRPGLGPGKLR